jgi:mono/diheme cytochrome c family protein
MVAYVWQSNTTAQALNEGRRLFAQDCAACHGETGQGNSLHASGAASQGPADFTNSYAMMGASPALLQGKMLRGGNGTGMPAWGTILTDQQTWQLVAYLYSFQFEYHW